MGEHATSGRFTRSLFKGDNVMAKVRSAVFNSIRGSIGGTTYFPGPHNSIIARARVTPVNPSTVRQGYSRSGFQEAVTNWALLTSVRRSNWNKWANSITRTDKMGDQYTPSGRQEFIASYSLAAFLRNNPGTPNPGNFLSDPKPPKELGLQPLPSIVVSIDGPETVGETGFTVGFSIENGNLDQVQLVQIGDPVSDAVNYYRGPWDQPTDENVANVNKDGTLTTVDFTDLFAGVRYPVRIRTFTSPYSLEDDYGLGIIYEQVTFATAVTKV